jgi:glutathione S-transferase
MLTIWGRPSSFNTQKVLWLADELGLAYRHIRAGGSFGGLDRPEFLAMNPHGRVPVIDDDGTVVWESHAILRYLAARYGSGRFWRDDPGERSRSDAWMDWSQTRLQHDFLNGVFWGFYRTPEPLRDAGAVAKSLARCTADFRLLDQVLSAGCISAARRSASRTFRPEPRSIVISSSTSSARPFPTSKPGIAGCGNARPIGRG